MLRINDTIIIITYGINHAINNCGRLRDLILLFEISIGTRKNFVQIYRQFGHAHTKTFTITYVGLEVGWVPEQVGLGWVVLVNRSNCTSDRN
jgi:hypothetical protein